MIQAKPVGLIMYLSRKNYQTETRCTVEYGCEPSDCLTWAPCFIAWNKLYLSSKTFLQEHCSLAHPAAGRLEVLYITTIENIEFCCLFVGIDEGVDTWVQLIWMEKQTLWACVEWCSPRESTDSSLFTPVVCQLKESGWAVNSSVRSTT